MLCVAVPLGGVAAEERWSKIERQHGFRGWRRQLQRMVDEDGRFPIGHSCVVVANGSSVAPDSRYPWVYVYFRETAELYTFSASTSNDFDMLQFKTPLNLRTDVVATEKGIDGSTYRVTRAWVDNILTRCSRFGTQASLAKQIR